MLIKKLRFILASLVCLLCVTISFTQSSILQLVPDTKHDYTDGITQDKLHKFGSFFSQDPARSEVSKKKAKQQLLMPDLFNPDLENLVHVITDTLIPVKLKQLSKFKFQAGDHIGPLHDFGYLFENNPQSKEDFGNYIKIRKKQANSRIVASSLIGIGIVGVVVIAQTNLGDGGPGSFGTLSLGALGLGGFIGLHNGIVNGSQKEKYRARLLLHIDPTMVHHTLKAPSLNLAFTQNGVGLVYQF